MVLRIPSVSCKDLLELGRNVGDDRIRRVVACRYRTGALKNPANDYGVGSLTVGWQLFRLLLCKSVLSRIFNEISLTCEVKYQKNSTALSLWHPTIVSYHGGTWKRTPKQTRGETRCFLGQIMSCVHFMCKDLPELFVFRDEQELQNNQECLPTGLASDWLRHFGILWNRLTEFNETWQEARSQHPLPSFCFSGRSEKQDDRPDLWLVETFSTSLKPLNGIQRNLTGSKILNILYKVCVFRADRKNKMAALISDWLRHFRLLHWNLWTEFNETWQ